VASPEPRRILEIDAVRLLVEGGVLVICAGGGGVPLVRGEAGELIAADGVIDKDLTSALLAASLHADRLLLLTDVDAVYDGWGTPAATPIREGTPREMRRLQLAPGSMGPKVEAACRFVEATSRSAAIGAMADACAILDGRTGTMVHA
jgi:carbamate kinase